MKKKLGDTISLQVFRNSGKRGGLTTLKRGKEFYKTIGKLGGLKRWENAKIAPKIDMTETEKSVK